MSSNTLSKPRLVYFSSRGLAEQIRVILAETGTDYDDVGFGNSEGGKEPSMLTQLKSEGKLMFDQVPLWEEPSGIRLVQSSAIVRHLARTKGLYGKNEEEASLCDILHEYWFDVRSQYIVPIVRSDKKEEMKKNFVEVDTPKVLTRLDKILGKNGTGFLVGHQLTFVDLLWWYATENFSDQGLADLSKYEHLNKWKSSIEARPKIAAYRKNPNRYPIQYMFPRYVMHCYPGGYNPGKAMIAASYGGLTIEYPSDFQFGTHNKTPEFLKKNPNGEVPVLDTPDGSIYESNAIAKYVTRKGNDKGLYGSNDYETSVIDQWIEWNRSKLEKSIGQWVYPVLGYMTYNEEKYPKSKSKVASAFKILNQALEGREWIVGKRVTLADIIFFCSLYNAFQMVLEPTFMQPFPNIVAWAKRCIAQPQFSGYFDKFTLATEEKKAKK